MEINYQVNDSMDICLRIRPIGQKTSLKEDSIVGDLIYIQKGTANMSKDFVDA